MKRLFAVLVALVLAFPAHALEPGELLRDPVLEARARAISQLLRCPQCQSENIDNSDAMVARDIRRFVRERLLAGDDDKAVLAAVEARFGEFVLFLPRPEGINWGLWLGGPLFLGFAVFAFGRQFRRKIESVELSAEERAQFDRLMSGGEPKS